MYKKFFKKKKKNVQLASTRKEGIKLPDTLNTFIATWQLIFLRFFFFFFFFFSF